MLVPLREEMRLLPVSDILEPLSEEELVEFAKRNPEFRLDRGELLFTQDEPAETLHIVKQGRIQIHKTTPEGQEVTLAIATKAMSSGRWHSPLSALGACTLGLWNHPF
jgi:CRP-like cAMP-binding protein